MKHPSYESTFLALFLLFLASSVLDPDSALAVGNIHLGPLKVNSFLEASESYDDNLYLSPSDEKEEFITVVSPGVRLELPFLGRHVLKAGYRADLYAFADNEKENRQDQKADALLYFNFPGGLEITAANIYTLAAEPSTHEFVGKRFFVENWARAEVGYRFVDVWKIQLNYENIYQL